MTKKVALNLILIIFFVVFVLFAYNYFRPNPTLNEGLSPQKREEIKIELAHSANFFGGGPAYRLTIYADGRVVYMGEKNVRVKGPVESRISQRDLQRLVEEIKRIKFFSLRDIYGAPNKGEPEGCPSYLFDCSTVEIRVELNGKEKAVHHDLCCMGENNTGIFPAELYELEKLIDSTVKSSQWVE